MLLKPIISTVFLFSLIGLGATAIFQKLTSPKEPSWVEKHSLTAIAKRTKANGKQSVTIPAPRIDYGGQNMTLDEAVGNYSIIVAELITSQSYVFNSDTITTWYKFSLQDSVSKKIPKLCDSCSPLPDLPQDLTPPQSNEFLLVTAGGSVWLEGVHIKMENRTLPEFQKGTKYLLFLSMDPSGIARLAGGPSGVFRVKDNQILESVNGTKTRMKEEMESRFASNLFSLKGHVKLPLINNYSLISRTHTAVAYAGKVVPNNASKTGNLEMILPVGAHHFRMSRRAA